MKSLFFIDILSAQNDLFVIHCTPQGMGHIRAFKIEIWRDLTIFAIGSSANIRFRYQAPKSVSAGVLKSLHSTRQMQKHRIKAILMVDTLVNHCPSFILNNEKNGSSVKQIRDILLIISQSWIFTVDISKADVGRSVKFYKSF